MGIYVYRGAVFDESESCEDMIGTKEHNDWDMAVFSTGRCDSAVVFRPVRDGASSFDGDEVHVWRLALDGDDSRARHCLEILSKDELVKSEKFRFKRDRDRFVVCRGALREILAPYLDLLPKEIEFKYNPQGKPFLSASAEAVGLKFNVSHSEGFALVGVTLAGEIGVDLEHIRHDIEYTQIAERFFSHNEAESLRELPPHEQARAFFACWTRKEAYVKACGGGLSIPLDRFEVSLTPDQGPVRFSSYDDENESSRWSLQSFVPWPDCMAALCVGATKARGNCSSEARNPDSEMAVLRPTARKT
ncbi:MAG: 4'-phosphopantetheinyl transferase superfamily protein [Chloroflexi bacterium]|nr:4'-phosphopantetheinyl transferase superfamily protein [Chloroflexota bacterium]